MSFPKAYLRLDPNIDAHPDWEGIVLLMLWANRQPRRGYFQPATVTKILGRKRAQEFLVPRPGKKRPDLVEQRDGTLYLDGWDDWQEGDLTVGERVRRLRAKRSATVTAPLPTRTKRHKALGVRRQALGSRHESTNGGAVERAGGNNGGPPAPPASASRWILDHDEGDPLERRLAARIAHLARLVAERDGEADPLEILKAVSSTPEGKSLDHIRGAPDRWIEPTLRACDEFEADLTGGDEPPGGA